MAKKPFSANSAAQPVYSAIHSAIKDLDRGKSIEVLEEIQGNIESQIEAIQQELKGEE